MILLVQHRPDGAIHSVAFVPSADSDSLELSGELPVVRVAARDALKSWKGEALSGLELRQECGRARAELQENYRVRQGKLMPRG